MTDQDYGLRACLFPLRLSITSGKFSGGNQSTFGVLISITPYEGVRAGPLNHELMPSRTHKYRHDPNRLSFSAIILAWHSHHNGYHFIKTRHVIMLRNGRPPRICLP